MASRNLLRMLRSALQTEQGRSAGRKAVDGLGGAVDKATKGKHTSKIEKARRAAHDYLDRGDGRSPRGH